MKEEARTLLEKGDRALHAAETLLRDSDYEFAAGRAYYAMLHAAQALLREHDLRYRKHASVHAAFGQHFAKTGQLDPNITAGCWMPLMIGSEVTTMPMFRSIGSLSQCGLSRPGSFWQPPGGIWREFHDLP